MTNDTSGWSWSNWNHLRPYSQPYYNQQQYLYSNLSNDYWTNWYDTWMQELQKTYYGNKVEDMTNTIKDTATATLTILQAGDKVYRLVRDNPDYDEDLDDVDPNTIEEGGVVALKGNLVLIYKDELDDNIRTETLTTNCREGYENWRKGKESIVKELKDALTKEYQDKLDKIAKL